jgi:prepilin-type processing-associated H-X9-DG protein
MYTNDNDGYFPPVPEPSALITGSYPGMYRYNDYGTDPVTGEVIGIAGTIGQFQPTGVTYWKWILMHQGYLSHAVTGYLSTSSYGTIPVFWGCPSFLYGRYDDGVDRASYGFNYGLPYDAGQTTAWNVAQYKAGKIDRVKHPSETMMLMDCMSALPYNPLWGPGYTVILGRHGGSGIRSGEILVKMGACMGLNAAFVDGHVELIQMSRWEGASNDNQHRFWCPMAP